MSHVVTRRRPRRALLLTALLAAGLAAPAAAATAEDCGALAARMEHAEDIPPGLLQAVALAESGRTHPTYGDSRPWPWTVRAGVDSFYLPSKDAALRKVQELRAAGRSNIDVGCMQINLGHHPTAFASLDEAFDPPRNVAYAASFLKALRAETRSWAKATGRYHSGDADRGQAYRARVWRLWRDLRREAGDAPLIGQAMFVNDGLARLAGGSAATAPEPAAHVRLITPATSDRGSAAIAVLRGR